MIEKLKELYKKFSPRERILFYGTIGAFVLMLTDLLVLGPILSQLSVLDAEIRAKAQSIQRDMRILSFKQSIYKEYHNYETYLDTGEKSQDEIIAGLLRKLETIAAQHTITITNVMPGELEDKPIYKIYKTTLDFEGALKDVVLFMNHLEESDNLFQVGRYQMEPKSKTGTQMKCSMDISRILITAEDMEPFREGMEEDAASAEAPGTSAAPEETPPPAVQEEAAPASGAVEPI